MAVWYLEAGNDQSNSGALIECFLCQANPFCDNHEVA